MARVKVTDEQVARMQELRSGGLSYGKIAQLFHISYETVRYHLNPEAKEYRARYYQKNKGRLQATRAKYYQKRRQNIREQHKAWYEANKERDNERRKKYRKEHLAQDRKKHAEYYKTHQAECDARRSQRRAFLIGALVGASIEQKAEIKEIYRRAKEDKDVRCYICGKKIPLGHRHVDHIVPLSKGGKHAPSNLAIACDKCNLSKHDKLPEEMGFLL